MKKLSYIIIALCLAGGTMFSLFKKSAANEGFDYEASHLSKIDSDKVDWKSKDKAYWKSVLSPLQYTVTREAGTERSFTGKYWDNKEDGIYICSNCGQHLFDASTKYKSGTGWPSFWDVINKSAVNQNVDTKFGMKRVEIVCSRCDAHLGHVFEDGPDPTGLRYCMNSVSLIHIPKKK
nr:peptide-methionine (R)-S-oxide reductase MsrB [Halobacteriovorax sp. HLS]